MNHSIKISIENMSQLVLEMLTKFSVPEEDAKVILETIIFANRRGTSTHGVGRLPLYINKIEKGHLNPKTDIKIIKDELAFGLIDASNGFGQVAAFHAVNLAVQKAKKYGISIVGIRNSNNFGAAGFYSDLCAQKGFASLIFANAAPAIAPTGGSKTIFGTNPLSFGFPGNDFYNPIILDMATTVVARGKIRLAAKNGDPIPNNWALGPDGKPTTDPKEALIGSLLPIGGYKGYGLSMFVDIFAGLLTGSAYAGEVKNLSKMDSNSGNGNLFILIDISKFLTEDELNNRIETFYNNVKSCGTPGSVYMPGEIEYLNHNKSPLTVEISSKQFEEINELAENNDIVSRLTEVNYE